MPTPDSWGRASVCAAADPSAREVSAPMAGSAASPQRQGGRSHATEPTAEKRLLQTPSGPPRILSYELHATPSASSRRHLRGFIGSLSARCPRGKGTWLPAATHQVEPPLVFPTEQLPCFCRISVKDVTGLQVGSSECRRAPRANRSRSTK